MYSFDGTTETYSFNGAYSYGDVTFTFDATGKWDPGQTASVTGSSHTMTVGHNGETFHAKAVTTVYDPVTFASYTVTGQGLSEFTITGDE